MKRGEIYYIENKNAVGCEQRGRRPAVIVGNDVGNKYSPVLLVVYFTLQPKKHLPTHVYVRGYGTALCEQIFTIDRTRVLQKKKGECTNSDMERINKALCISLGMEENIWQGVRNTITHQYRNARR